MRARGREARAAPRENEDALDQAVDRAGRGVARHQDAEGNREAREERSDEREERLDTDGVGRPRPRPGAARDDGGEESPGEDEELDLAREAADADPERPDLPREGDHERREQKRDHDRIDASGPVAGTDRPRAACRLPPGEEEQRSCGEMEARDLHEDGEARAEARGDEPSGATAFEVLEERRGAERREEQHVPGRHRRRVDRHRPGDREADEQGGDERARESRGDPEERRHPEREHEKQRDPHRPEVRPKHAEGPGVPPAEPARVDLVEVAVGELARQDAIGRLGKRSLVVRDPAVAERRPDVDERDDPQRDEDGPPSPALSLPFRPRSHPRDHSLHATTNFPTVSAFGNRVARASSTSRGSVPENSGARFTATAVTP
jgi:hypothetical protein